MPKPVIAIAGLACETSTFSPARTLAAAFHPRRGDDVLQYHPFLRSGTRLGDAADWQGSLVGHALPGGMVTRRAFEDLSEEIIMRLQTIVAAAGGTIQGLWYDIHGAMCVEDVSDAEAELLRRIRTILGPNVIVAASMDLHGNVSRDLVHQTDLITCYRTAPHIDVAETRQRTCRNLLNLLSRAPEARRPIKVWVPIPILLPGEQTSTRVEPAKHIYAAVPEVEAVEDVIDAAIWVGYAWADEPRNRAAAVVTGWDKEVVSAGAEKLARMFWNARKDFKFVAKTGSLAQCLDTALASNAQPYFISDSGDNPTAGGSGDVSWGLAQLLARPEFKDPSGPVAIYASLPGPDAIRIAVEAGIGAEVTVTAGAEVDNLHAGPLTITGRVHSIKQGDKDALVEVVLQIGSVYAIITKLRKPYHHEQDFTDLELVPRAADIVVIKIGYLEPELFDMAAGWMLGLTPGGVDQDIVRLGHHRIYRPMWPFDRSFPTEPNLRGRIIPPSNELLEGPDE